MKDKTKTKEESPSCNILCGKMANPQRSQLSQYRLGKEDLKVKNSFVRQYPSPSDFFCILLPLFSCVELVGPFSNRKTSLMSVYWSNVGVKIPKTKRIIPLVTGNLAILAK